MYFKKFFAYTKMYWKQSIVYKLSFMSSIVISPLMLFMTYFIWKAVFMTTTSVFGYSFEDMITYYVIGMLINHFIFNMVGNALQEKIIYGELSEDLLRPFPVLSQLLASDVAERAFAFVVEVIPVFIISFLIFKIKTTFIFGALFIVSMILAFFLNFMLGFLMGMLAFWMNKIESVQWMMFLFVRFLSGEHIPLEFFGNLIFSVSQFLPFFYLRYGVIQIFLGRYGVIGSLTFLLKQLVWIVILYIIIQIIWRMAIKRYGAVG